MDVRVVRRRFERAQPAGAPRGRRPRDGPPQLRDHGPALGRVAGADRDGDERQAEGRLLAHPREGGMGTGRDLRGPERGHRRPEGARRRRDGPGPWWSGLRQVADAAGPRRRVPAVDGPDCDRRGPQPVRGSRGAPEARGRRRATVPQRSPRADPRAEAMPDTPREGGGAAGAAGTLRRGGGFVLPPPPAPAGCRRAIAAPGPTRRSGIPPAITAWRWRA